MLFLLYCTLSFTAVHIASQAVLNVTLNGGDVAHCSFDNTICCNIGDDCPVFLKVLLNAYNFKNDTLIGYEEATIAPTSSDGNLPYGSSVQLRTEQSPTHFSITIYAFFNGSVFTNHTFNGGILINDFFLLFDVAAEKNVTNGSSKYIQIPPQVHRENVILALTYSISGNFEADTPCISTNCPIWTNMEIALAAALGSLILIFFVLFVLFVARNKAGQQARKDSEKKLMAKIEALNKDGQDALKAKETQLQDEIQARKTLFRNADAKEQELARKLEEAQEKAKILLLKLEDKQEDYADIEENVYSSLENISSNPRMNKASSDKKPSSEFTAPQASSNGLPEESSYDLAIQVSSNRMELQQINQQNAGEIDTISYSDDYYSDC